MTNIHSRLVALVLECGAAGAAVIPVGDIPFRREFRDACEQNTCGKYGRCWMCPPDVGEIDAMIRDARRHSHGLFFHTVSPLADAFDIEGMETAAKKHNQLTQTLADAVSPLVTRRLMLGAGACHVCARCARLDNVPCRFPGRAVASLESYGIAVSELTALCQIPYNGGLGTVTYIGGFLFQ